LQENVGAIDIYPSDSTREDFIKTLTLDWKIFPPGTIEEIVGRLRRKIRRSDTRTDAILRDRIETFSKLKPRAYIQGTNGFNSYIGAQFADDLVAFENVRYGNALYVLYDDWESVSRRSRIDLTRGTDIDLTGSSTDQCGRSNLTKLSGRRCANVHADNMARCLVGEPVKYVREPLVDVASFPFGYILKHCTDFGIPKWNNKPSPLGRRVTASP
jgi:hypothetical protein